MKYDAGRHPFAGDDAYCSRCELPESNWRHGSRHSVTFDVTDAQSDVVVDGVDISTAVSAITVSQTAGGLPHVEVDLLNVQINASLDAACVVEVNSATREALEVLG